MNKPILSLLDIGRWYSLSFHRECDRGSVEIFHFSRSIREKGVTKIVIHWNSTVAGINCMLCLAMFYLFWLSPHPGFSVSLPCYPFTQFAGFVASAVAFIGQWMKGLWCLLGLERGWLSVNSLNSPLALVGPGALQNCWAGSRSLPLREFKLQLAYCVPSGRELLCWRE